MMPAPHAPSHPQPIDPLMGPAYPELGWVPAPRYLLRRARVLAHIQGLAPGRVVEVGVGAGALLGELSRAGWQAQGLEISAAARAVAGKVLAPLEVPVHAQAPAQWTRAQDLVVSLDVLEHIQDDVAAMAQWASWLKPDGRLVLSVPAHPHLWTRADEWVGHVRRYTHAALLERVAGSGLEVMALECYGFPLANLTERLQSWPLRASAGKTTGRIMPSRRHNNDRSGIERTTHLRFHRALASPLGRLGLKAALWTQARFFHLDWGSGYLVIARRPQ